MSVFEPRPDTELRDDPERRAEADIERYAIPTSLFRRILDEAIDHAVVPARRDPNAANLPWRPLGPRNVGGRIRTIAQDPINPAVLYAGSAQGGLWKSRDGGDSWVSLDDFRPPNPPNNLPQALPIGAVAVARSNPQVIYVGTGEPVVNKLDFDYKISGAGLYWSTDGGQTLVRIDHPDVGTGAIASKNFERIRVDPWEPRRLWIASPTRGLWRGSPAGAFPTAPGFAQDVVDAPGAPAAADQDASDVVVDFGDPSGPPPAKYRVYAALRGTGIYLATFDRGSNSYDTDASGKAWARLESDRFPDADPDPGKRAFHRVKLALCERYPRYLFAVFALSDNRASNVLVSADRGRRWRETASRPGDDGEQAWYDLVLEVHPRDPEVIFTGSVDLFRTFDGGRHWNKAMDWHQYNAGDRAQHADQHAFVFDAVDSRKVWAGNDGGLSVSENLGLSWRKRSHGILAAQFNDVTVHPDFPMITGGGLQDNGTWVGFGGPTWHYLYGGDGGAIGFEPNDPRAYHVTTQNGVRQARIRVSDDFQWLYANPLPDIGPDERMRVEILEAGSGFSGAHKSTFYAILEHHPDNPDEAMIGRRRAAYRTTDGRHFENMDVGEMREFRPAGNDSDYYIPQVSALAYGPNPNSTWWAGTSRGELFRTLNGGTDWHEVAPAAANGTWISQIAVHPVNPQIVAFSLASNPGRVFLSGDQGSHWVEISGRHADAPAPGADRLGPSPNLALAFDPATPNPPAGPHSLYLGTLAGVYVIRNAVAPAAAPGGPLFNPVWRTLNVGMPIVQIYDLKAVRYLLPGGLIKTLLRAATFGRGIYECELDGAPPVRLLMRNDPLDDGKPYPVAARPVDDPRVPPGRVLADLHHLSLDIRIDAPPFRRFGAVLDGAELDEEFASEDRLIAGDLNLVYVQVHNTGAGDADPVEVHLYFADTSGTPPRAPDLAAGFWASFPAPAAPWRLAGTRTVRHLQPTQPHVLRFQWPVPPDLGAEVALLAICTHSATDDIVARLPDGSPRPPGDPLPPVVVDPRTPDSLVGRDRRAALRILAVERFSPDPYVRDGIDDRGAGAVAWGGRSADIAVLGTTASAELDAALAAGGDIDDVLHDLGDPRSSDRLRSGEDHRIHVRVHNRRKLAVEHVSVHLFALQMETLQDPSSWVSLGDVEIPRIDAEGSRFAAAIPWDDPPDPNPESDYKVWLLLAILGLSDAAGPADAAPDHSTVDGPRAFWRLILAGERNNNVALRTIRWQR
jgi:photosystem II stability/assembly factor-like uncharacterized protein